jgi:SAM-dependent methyltransferase
MRTTQEKPDYKDYLKWQKERALKKWGLKEYAKVLFKQNFKAMWREVSGVIGQPKVIGCMGIRNGAEYFEFKQYLPESVVYGIDIQEKVVEVGENCYCCDFNNLPKDWEEKFDLLFSNSLDHSFEVTETIEEWRRVTKKGGFILIQFSSQPRSLSYTDRYSFEEADIPILFPANKYELISMPIIREEETFYALFKKI